MTRRSRHVKLWVTPGNDSTLDCDIVPMIPGWIETPIPNSTLKYDQSQDSTLNFDPGSLLHIKL